MLDKMNDLLALTWSPQKQSVEPQYGLTDFIDKYFKNWFNAMSYIELYPELNLNGALHFHAIIQLKDKIKWYKQLLPYLKHNGFVSIKTIFDVDGWREYLNKDKKNMEHICEIKLPITKEYLNEYITQKRLLYKKAKNTDHSKIINMPKSINIEDCLSNLIEPEGIEA